MVSRECSFLEQLRQTRWIFALQPRRKRFRRGGIRVHLESQLDVILVYHNNNIKAPERRRKGFLGAGGAHGLNVTSYPVPPEYR